MKVAVEKLGSLQSDHRPQECKHELVASPLGWSLGVSGVKGPEERENERLQVNITSQ